MAKYKIEIKKSAAREIERLPAREIPIILAKIEALGSNPRSPECKKLSGAEKYRVRCGNYRIIYSVQDEVLIVLVVKVGHRKDVYR